VRFGDVEIPRDLINAHKAGELVLFVGAGASIDRPSNLPTFLGLTEKIRDESRLGDTIGGLQNQPLDEVMGDIEDKYDVDVHLRAMKHTAKKSSLPNRLHDAITRLSLCGEVRVVTTNYDTHLTTMLGTTVQTYLPPALPMGNEFTGLVYLHGSVTQPPKHLVVTARDFGRAYLTEAWATRFLERMFATYTTLFVGYSHNDVIMKYLARGLSPNTRPRYACTHEPDSGMWRQLNIIPVGYSPKNNHRALAMALGGWAQRASSGFLDHRRQIRAIMEGRPPGELSADETSYLESVISDENVVQFFCAYASGADWLAWVIDKPEFRALFDPQRTSGAQVTWRLAGWFARTYITPESSAESLAVCRSFGGLLSAELWDAIARRLLSLQRTDSFGLQAGPWLVALTRATPTQSTIFLGMLLSHCTLPADMEAATLLFSYLTDPQIVDRPAILGGLRGEVRLRGDVHQLRDWWTEVLRPSLQTAAAELLPIVDQHIRKAHRNVRLSNESEAGETLGSPVHPIATVSGRGYAEHVDFLVEVARDSVEALLEHDLGQGIAQLAAWASSDVVLLRRLAIHGWTIRRDIDAMARADWLVDQGLVLAYDYQSEITPLIARILESDRTDPVKAVVADILRHADDDKYSSRRALRTLHWMSERLPSEDIERAIIALTDAHQDLQSLLQAIESASAPTEPPLTTRDELTLHLNGEDLPSAIALLDDYAAQEPPPDVLAWDGIRSTIAAAVARSPAIGFDLLDAVHDGSPLRPMTETSVIQGWSNATVDDQVADLILRTTATLNISESTDDIARMLAGFRGGPSKVEWARFGTSRILAKLCWDAIGAGEQEPNDDWLYTAVNSPAGQLAIYWIDALHQEQEMTAELSTQLAGMLTSGDSRADLAEVVFGLEVSFLHSLDAEWCQEHVLPLFDWEDPPRALRTWSGYLSGGRITEPLLRAGLLDGAVETASKAGSFTKKLQQSLFGLLAQIALRPEIDSADWLPQLMRNAETESRAVWADGITDGLRTMPPDEVEAQWTRWIRSHWSARIQSVPRRMNIREASAMAPWIIYLGQSLGDGVALALEHPAAFVEHSHLLRDLTEDRLSRDPDAYAQLVAHLLAHTELPFYGLGLSDVVQRLRRLGAAESTLGRITEHSFRLGLSLDDA
jgi:hypothetical protein